MMSDGQILTIAVTLIAIFAGSWFNNSRFGDTNNRISDLSNKLDTRITDLRDVLRAEMRLESERMIQKIDAVLQQLGSHETRITHLEER